MVRQYGTLYIYKQETKMTKEKKAKKKPRFEAFRESRAVLAKDGKKNAPSREVIGRGAHVGKD